MHIIFAGSSRMFNNFPCLYWFHYTLWY